MDLALDADKLKDGRYPELLKLLLDAQRYRSGTKSAWSLGHTHPVIKSVISATAPFQADRFWKRGLAFHEKAAALHARIANARH